MEQETANQAHRAELLEEIRQFQGCQLRRIRRMLAPPPKQTPGYFDDVNRPYNEAFLPPNEFALERRS